MSWIKRGKETRIEDVFLRNIGAESLNEINGWFQKSIKDEYRIDKLDEAVDFIKGFREQKVTIVGDYDADGVTSTSILYLCLKAVGFTDVAYRIPRRFSEGFGINVSIIDEISEGLVITCDNGIAQAEAIQKAKDKGLKVVIIDHHLPVMEGDKPVYPDADIIIDPNAIEGSADFNGYCGAGLCYRLAKRLLAGEEYKGLVQRLQCLAAVGTIADVMELRQENYVIVRNGLKAMLNATICPPGLYALISAFALTKKLSAKDVGFKIGPALNAASRMKDDGAVDAVRLLTFAGQYIHAVPLAEALVEVNETRKELKKKGIKEAEQVIADECMYGDIPMVINLPGIPEGIIGIIAGYVCEKYKVPAIVVTKVADGVLKGSGRSCGNYDIKAELDKLPEDILIRYGGHTGAAGLSLNEDRLSDFRNILNENATGFECESITDQYYDLEIAAKDLPKVMEELEKYAPYGEGNAEISFLIKEFSTLPRYGTFVKFMGADGSIVKIYSKNATGIGFDMSERFQGFVKPKNLNLIGYLSINSLDGEPQIEFSDFEVCKNEYIETPLANMLKMMATA